ncbi:uncharacterized protein LOC107272369 isoform X2 [Cephus cinctus]|uniref:Uncharacterized protein LOC107272369 isoform X2 n=3 Tax=Cephus cinctus TaxID=211228 RepID=A0AAJ7W691_CEPCN|nr:uncharacterized protein LOC107272369 isoform X2 [Cephus cinctus]XP_024945412.1 uncharacterized protein LOC107272369 isoform X2 [Cephus cinctus]XP_024945413.1 uncharacterized protein LOC107272369 isoform X2 [Cephus cinctus]XP_024945414.1 uncharacterized protein LOC107272369 isoform X2 [Cephus cinctus]XP_024945415.1 uncharacterized protein LOC107272369 isoform X2 [Cephus cinctus]XP_024945416.1 uncharacterized protein LOC107272369 isoform X2 [Cephus cinctus]XP_024945417.1 uncharacterized prot
MAAGSAVAMIGANLRFGIGASGNVTSNATKVFQCHPGGVTEATVIFSLGALGMGANIILMALILTKRQLRRWSQGLLFHQAMVDCARAAILLPLGLSILNCQPVNKCSLVETAFLLLVTVSTVNMLTTVLNDSPVFPESEEEADLTAPLLMDSPQCVLFGTFMIWFASITINLGPTFLSGALAANTETGHNAPSCPLVHGPFRHYILNVLWIVINVICVALTLFHLRKLHRDLTKANVEAVRVAGLVTTLVSVTGGHGGSNGLIDGCATSTRDGTTPKRTGAMEEHRKMRNYLRRMEREGVQRVRMFLVITAAYVIFWGPLFLVTLVHHPLIGNPTGYEVTLHIAYVHAFVNPALFLTLHRGLRQGMSDVCCGCCESIARWILGSTTSSPIQTVQPPRYEPPLRLPSPPDPPLPSSGAICDLTDVALLKPPLPPAAKHLLRDDSMSVPPDPWSLVTRPKSTLTLYDEELNRRPSLLLPPPPELNDLTSPISPSSSDLPSE